MNTFFRRAFFGVMLGVAAMAVHAQEFRVGFINTERILKEANAAKQAQTKLEQEFSKREKELLESDKTFKSVVEKFEREAPTMSESQRASRQKQLAEQDRDLKRRGREFQEELNARRNEEMQQIYERTGRAVRQVGESEKFDMIVEAAGVAYMNPKHDITDKVLKAINAGK